MNKEKLIQNLEQIKRLIEKCLLGFSGKVKSEIMEEAIEQSTSLLREVDFNMNERAFIKKYSKGMSGSKKFVLVLAYIVKDKVGLEKSLNEIKGQWNKMTSLLKGKFNRYYSATAKENNWVDSKKTGFYHLTLNWKDIFQKTKK